MVILNYRPTRGQKFLSKTHFIKNTLPLSSKKIKKEVVKIGDVISFDLVKKMFDMQEQNKRILETGGIVKIRKDKEKDMKISVASTSESKQKIKISGNLVSIFDYEAPIKKREYYEVGTGVCATKTQFDYQYISTDPQSIKLWKDLLKYCNEIKKTDDEKLFQKNRSLYESMRRSQNAIIDIVNSNMFRYKETPKFLTLTFAEEVESLDVAHQEFAKFMRRLSKSVSKQENFIKYVAVPEIQEKRFEKTNKKVWHYHMIMFNAPYVEHKKLLKLWGLGSVYIEGFMRDHEFKKLTWNEQENSFEFEDKTILKSVARYIAKTIYYSIKDIEDRTVGKNRRCYLASRGLFKPLEVYTETSILEKTKEKNINFFDEMDTSKVYDTPVGNVTVSTKVLPHEHIAELRKLLGVDTDELSS